MSSINQSDDDNSYHRLQPSPSYAAGQHTGGSIDMSSTFGTHFESDLSDGMHLPEVLSREDIIRSCKHFKPLKPINPTRIRWNLVWLAFIWLFITLPIWLPYLGGCTVAFYGVAGILCWLNVVWLLAVGFTTYYIIFLYRNMGKDYKLQYSANTPCYHIIVLTIYKDEMDVVMRTVDSIAAQTEAKRIVMLLAWEGRTPDREERTRMMKERFANSFHMLLFSVHPFGLPHEIASKAANANWGLRYAVRHMFERVGHGNIEHFMVSTCDSDTLFHHRYFESLTADYLRMLNEKHPETHRTIWQAPLFYNWNLDQNSFITRITGLLRTTMTMGCLIPYSVNPMSCFSFSLTLAIKGGYWHPQIFMDDVGYLLTMQIGVQDRVKIRCLPVPVLSGPTSGATWLLDIWEWYVQVRRWGIGTADNFHFMCVKIMRLPFSAAFFFTLGYFLYYGVILCSASLFSVSSCTFQFICNESDLLSGHLSWVGQLGISGLKPSHILFFLTILPYVFYGVMFILDCVWIRAILHVKEDISAPRNIVHWLMTGPSLIALSLVQFWSYHVLAYKGKVGACIHQLAGKATLGSVQIDGMAGGAAHGQSQMSAHAAAHVSDVAFENSINQE